MTFVEKIIYFHIDSNESLDIIATRLYMWFSQNNDLGMVESAADCNSGWGLPKITKFSGNVCFDMFHVKIYSRIGFLLCSPKIQEKFDVTLWTALWLKLSFFSVDLEFCIKAVTMCSLELMDWRLSEILPFLLYGAFFQKGVYGHLKRAFLFLFCLVLYWDFAR